MDDRQLQEFETSLNSVAFAPKELRDAPTVFSVANELAEDIKKMREKLNLLDELLGRVAGSLLDASHRISGSAL
jgi:hypothetical protein